MILRPNLASAAIFLFFGIMSNAAAFAPRAFVAAGNIPVPTSLSHGSSEQLATTAMIPPQFTDVVLSSSLAVAQEGGVGGDPTAFTDQVSYFDGTIQTMIIAAVGVVAVLVAIKALGGAMDDAIGKVLEDFEETMKEGYPTRWEDMGGEELEGLEEPERSQKIFQMMETLKRDSPDFYQRVMDKMTKR